MDCNNYITVKEWFNTVGRDFKGKCEINIRLMNDVLQWLWLDTYKLKNNVNYIPFSNAGIQSFVSPYPIYDIDGFYVIASSCYKGCGFLYDKHNVCYNSCCGEHRFYQMQMHDVIRTTCLLPCQYQYCRDSKKIEANIPNTVSQGFIRYYRGFEIITSLDDELPVQPSLLPAVKFLMHMYYTEFGNSFANDDAKWEARYRDFIEKFKEKDALKLYTIDHHGEV